MNLWSRSFEGTIWAPEEGFVFIPTFNHPGWKVKVDNEPVEVTAIRDSFMLIPVSEGEHQIEAKFTPPGFYAGLLISLLTAGACLFYLLMRKKKLPKATVITTDHQMMIDNKGKNYAHKMRKTEILNSVEQ